MDTQKFEARKRAHIQHALDSAHQAMGLSGLQQIHLVHEALPDLDFQSIHLRSTCLGRLLQTPFYIAGMTAGHPDAIQINRTLALACQARGWAMGVGSQRRELETSEISDSWEKLRNEVPELTLFANIGISQLISTKLSQIRQLVGNIRAQALVVHTNALQEALQPEGTPQFKGTFEALKRCCAEMDVPVILKETGCGFSLSTLQRLSSLKLAAIDLSGLGGTHWGRIEGARSEENSIFSAASATFANWGEPTVQSVLSAVEVLSSEIEIWASGGVRSGLDAAKLIALGAHRVGYAQPALQAALKSFETLNHWMELQEYELKVALFCTNSVSTSDLRRKEGVWRVCGI